MDAEIANRIAAMTKSYYADKESFYNRESIPKTARIRFFLAKVTASAIYGCQVWNFRAHHIKALDNEYKALLKRMTGLTDYKVSWEALIRYCTAHGCTIVPLSIRVQQLQLRYTGHVARMSFERIQKTILYSKHATGGPNPGPKRSFQHNVTTALRNFAVDKGTWEEFARHRKSWKTSSLRMDSSTVWIDG